MNKAVLAGLGALALGTFLLAYPSLFSNERHEASVGGFKMSVKAPRYEKRGPHPAWGVASLVAGAGLLGYGVSRKPR